MTAPQQEHPHPCPLFYTNAWRSDGTPRMSCTCPTASQQEPGDPDVRHEKNRSCERTEEVLDNYRRRAVAAETALHQAEERADPQAIDGIFEKLGKPRESNLYNVPGYIGEVQRSLHQAEEALRVANRIVEYAANAPDDPEMPEWLREMQHHARQLLSTKDTKP